MKRTFVLIVFSIGITGVFLILAEDCGAAGNNIIFQSVLTGDAKPKIPIKAHPFKLKQVRLLDGPFKDAMERNRKYLHALDPERLLHNYRVTAGLFGCSMLKSRQQDYRGQ